MDSEPEWPVAMAEKLLINAERSAVRDWRSGPESASNY